MQRGKASPVDRGVFHVPVQGRSSCRAWAVAGAGRSGWACSTSVSAPRCAAPLDQRGARGADPADLKGRRADCARVRARRRAPAAQPGRRFGSPAEMHGLPGHGSWVSRHPPRPIRRLAHRGRPRFRCAVRRRTPPGSLDLPGAGPGATRMASHPVGPKGGSSSRSGCPLPVGPDDTPPAAVAIWRPARSRSQPVGWSWAFPGIRTGGEGAHCTGASASRTIAFPVYLEALSAVDTPRVSGGLLSGVPELAAGARWWRPASGCDARPSVPGPAWQWASAGGGARGCLGRRIAAPAVRRCRGSALTCRAPWRRGECRSVVPGLRDPSSCPGRALRPGFTLDRLALTSGCRGTTPGSRYPDPLRLHSLARVLAPAAQPQMLRQRSCRAHCGVFLPFPSAGTMEL